MEFNQALDLVQGALSNTSADEVEAIVHSRAVGATRFARNAITQNQFEDSLGIRIRIVKDGRQGVVSGNNASPEVLTSLIEKALASAALADKDTELLPMLDQQIEIPQVEAWDETTANAEAELRAKMVRRQIEAGREEGLEMAGLLESAGAHCAYLNSHGIRHQYRRATASLTISAFADNGRVEGMADVNAMRIKELDADHAGKTAIAKALGARGSEPVEPGEYEVILEPSAFSDPMLFFGRLGFGSQAVAEGRSPMCGKVGEKVFHESLNVKCDPYHPMHQSQPFDWEGFARQPVTLVENGIVRDFPTDRRTAKSLSLEVNGYANPQPDSSGPMPSSLVVSGGDSDIQAMIANTDRGLLVSHFHYTNTVDAMRMSITGMTRGGTWLIEKGRIIRPVSNMRFTESLIRALQGIQALSSETYLCGGGLFGGGMVLPAIKLAGWTFSSPTGF